MHCAKIFFTMFFRALQVQLFFQCYPENKLIKNWWKVEIDSMKEGFVMTFCLHMGVFFNSSYYLFVSANVSKTKGYLSSSRNTHTKNCHSMYRLSKNKKKTGVKLSCRQRLN